MTRPDWKKAVKIPVGVVPGGSGNGLARTISYAAGEPYDATAVIPSVLNIICGRVAPMDLVRVQTPTECFYSFLSIGWGLMADIDIESERLRAIGEARFAVWAVIRAIGLRKYKGKLSYLPVHGYKPDQPAKIITEPKPKRSKTLDSHLAWSDNPPLEEAEQEHFPIFRSKSFGANDPDIEDENKTVRLLKFSYSGEEFVESPPLAIIGSLVDQPYGEENLQNIPHLHCTEGRGDTDNLELQKEENVTAYLCPPLNNPVPDHWVVVDDEFVLVYVCEQTHISTDVLFAPDAKLDDGIMWLIMIRAGVSRAQVMYFLACLQTGDHVHIPYVDVIPIQAFRLEPLRTDSFLTVDGEVIPCCTIQAEVLPSIARVMSR
ncbi:Sphingosine kinase 2, partial [Stegodyphus mimosarum]